MFLNPPNPNFIFYDKLPKCGSSTLNTILRFLQKKHHFNFRKIEPSEVALQENQQLLDILDDEFQSPYFLLNHHYFFDFSKFNWQQPTYINVIRDPLEWFTSRFYFARFGWNRSPGCRSDLCKMTEEEQNMTIDECVAKRHPQCTDSTWLYLPFICGSSPECLNRSTTEQRIASLEISKQHVLQDYYFVGILEQFEETLMLLEHLLPSYFKGAVAIWKKKNIQEVQKSTKTKNRREMNEESRKFFLEGPLKYEQMFYDFTRKIFNERLKYFQISLSDDDI